MHKRSLSDTLSPEIQDRTGKRQLIKSPPGFGAMLRLDNSRLELTETDLKEALGSITPEGVKLALILNNRQKEVVNDITNTLDHLDVMYSQMKTTQDNFSRKIQGMEKEISGLREENKRLKTKSEDLENYSRRNNLIITDSSKWCA